uniref:DUF711 family protein n=1 Tax=Thermofilum pendens TaxID=2269 RepID=A0A7C1T1R1_THEPE
MSLERRGFEVRAVTLHVKSRSLQAEIRLAELAESLKAFARETGLRIRSRRVVTEPVSPKELPRAAESVSTMAASAGFDYVAVPLAGMPEPRELAEVMMSYEKLYTSLEYNAARADEIVALLRTLSEVSPILGTRFAVSFGERLQTPYFPVTTTREEGVTLSLLYVRMFKENFKRLRDLGKTLKTLEEMSLKTLPDFLGVDLSLSPWMEESVAELVESVTGTVFASPGTISAVKLLNDAIARLAEGLRTVGFNEVMLPLAEDNRLKELAALGHLRLSHLLSYSLVCVAGLDMVVIPDDVEPRVLVGLLQDLEVIHFMKRKTLGLRLVLAPAKEGDEVQLGMFGKVPVISPLE